MKPKMVATDIGGTLTGDSGGIGRYTVDVLNLLMGKEIPVSFLTGYNYHSAVRYLKGMDRRAVLIVQNGAAALSQDRILWEYVIGEDDAASLVKAFQRWKIPVYVFRGSPTGFSNEIISESPVRGKTLFTHASGISDFKHILCVSVRGENLFLEKMLEESDQSIIKKYHPILSRGPDISWLEVTGLNARKDLALKRLCEMKSIGVQDVVYFGDNFNDLEVLKMVGHPRVVKNALPELKNQFDTLEYTSKEEGVARYLDRLFDLEKKREPSDDSPL